MFPREKKHTHNTKNSSVSVSQHKICKSFSKHTRFDSVGVKKKYFEEGNTRWIPESETKPQGNPRVSHIAPWAIAPRWGRRKKREIVGSDSCYMSTNPLSSTTPTTPTITTTSCPSTSYLIHCTGYQRSACLVTHPPPVRPPKYKCDPIFFSVF